MTVADLYEEHEEKMHAYALKLSRDPHLADDLVQDTFVRSMGHMPLFDQLNRHQCRAWLYQTLKNLFLDRRSARLREEALYSGFAQDVQTFVPADESALETDPFDLVPAADRELLEKRYRLGLTSREIATEIGIPAATVRSRLHLAVKKLRARKSRFL